MASDDSLSRRSVDALDPAPGVQRLSRYCPLNVAVGMLNAFECLWGRVALGSGRLNFRAKHHPISRRPRVPNVPFPSIGSAYVAYSGRCTEVNDKGARPLAR